MNTKNYVTVGILAFCLGVTAIATMSLMTNNNTYGNNVGLPSATPQQTAGSQTSPVLTPTVSGGITLTMTELAKHNSGQSCWLLIAGKVYDVTSFIRIHPGGAGQILAYCGQEATQAFATQGGQGRHSGSAQSMLATYYIGDLNAKSTKSTSFAPPSVPTAAAAGRSGDEVGDDD